jgi:predicted ATPase
VADPFLRSVELRPPGDQAPRAGYPWTLPAIAPLAGGVALHPRVTYLIGENGSGKSTLLEAIAVAAGMNAEGGSSSFAFSTRASHSELSDALRLVRSGRRPRTDFFLRAESLFNAATYLERLRDGVDGPGAGIVGDPLEPYGGRSLHEQSHGESFLAVMINRFGPDGLYLLDEPEAALSTQNCLTALRRIHELVQDRSQLIIATHSPIILAYPESTIFHCNERGLEPVEYEDAEPVRLTRSFLEARERFVRELLRD